MAKRSEGTVILETLPALETQVLVDTIDSFLSSVRYLTIVEGDKVRDLLLDLRSVVASGKD